MHRPPHPPVLHRPVLIWRTRLGDDERLRRRSDVLPYRPDWFARLDPAEWRRPDLRLVGYQHPDCALALLIRRYDEASAEFEPALQGAGEAAFHLLAWAESEGVRLTRAPSFYRQILVRDGYWGYRHARRTRDRTLLAEIDDWSAGHRREQAAAAAIFLLRRPREAVAPLADVLRSNPFYAYIALPHLHQRGFRVPAETVRTPKWAYQFGLSAFSREEGDFGACAMRDPAWAVEWLSARGELGDSARRREWAERIESAFPRHPLAGRAAAALCEARRASAVPDALAQGRTAETRALAMLQRGKNREVWRPSAEQIRSPEFKRIVGLPQYTDRGWPRGTILDSVEGELAEIKTGASPLAPTYQLRLQAYRAHAEERSLKIYTSRPVEPDFAQWLTPLGVAVEPLPD